MTMQEYRDKMDKIAIELGELQVRRDSIETSNLSEDEKKSALGTIDREMSLLRTERYKIEDEYRIQEEEKAKEWNANREESVLNRNIDTYEKRHKILNDYMRAFPHTEMTRKILDGQEVAISEVKEALKEHYKAEIARLKKEKEEKSKAKPVQEVKEEPKEKKESKAKEEVKSDKDKELEKIEQDLVTIQNQLKQYAAVYNELQEKLDEVIGKKFAYLKKEGLIMPEDIAESNKYDDIYNEILDKMKKTRKSAELLVAKKKYLQDRKNELLNIESKDKTPEDSAKEIIDAMDIKENKEKIIKAKGLQEIYDKKVAERTPEEMQSIRTELINAYNEILDYKEKNPEVSVTDIIEVLYNLEDKMEQKEEPNVIELPQEEIENIEQNVSLLPVKVNTQIVPTDYEPAPAPEDMKEVVPRGELAEKIIILVDEDGNKYIKASNPQRYGIKNYGEEINVEGSNYVQISEEDAEYVVENASNDISPYEVEFVNIEVYEDEDEQVEEFDNEIENEDEQVEEHDNEVENEKLTVEGIINKLTNRVVLDNADCDYYTASNIDISKEFRSELKEGDVLYNIVHILPASVKAVGNCVKKLYGKFMLLPEVVDEMETFNSRLDNLTDQELEILARDYTEDKELENDFINDQIIKKIEVYEASKHSDDEIKEMFEEKSEDIGDEVLKEAEGLSIDEMNDFLQEHFDNIELSSSEGKTR